LNHIPIGFTVRHWPEGFRGESRMIRPSLQRALIAFALIFAAGFLGDHVPSMGGRLPLMLLPSGLAVAAMCRWGRRQWPAVLLAGTAIDLTGHTPLLAALGVGIGLAAGAALSCWILEWGSFDSSFRRPKDVPLFVIAAAVGMTLAPGFARLGFFLSGMSGSAVPAPVHWIRWWGNVSAGVLLVAPALIAANRSSLKPLAERWGESILWLLGVAACCVAIFLAPGAVGRPVIALAALILMVVGTIHFGLVIAAAGAFAISALTAISFEFSRGAFGGLEELQGLVLTWTFVTALNFVCLSITALLAERDSAALAKLQAEHRYAQIFDGSPQPVWVHDRRTLRFLMINEAALRQYGWNREEILSMSAGALAPPGEPQWADDPLKTGGISTEPLETRHLTRDGRILEVEVWSRSIEFADQPAELVFAVDVTGRRAFGRALLDAIAGEQLRIGQEMHDGLGQELTGLALSVRALANRAARERDAIAEDLDQLASLVTGCIRDARLIVQGLTPLTDADGNLEAALEGLAQRSSLSGTEVRLHATREALVHIDLKARNHLYRIAQEAVQNALKHSGATAIRIELHAREESIRLGILDNGGGMSTENPAGIGLGMRTMRFRASAIGAKLTFSRRDEGNSVICEVAQPRTRLEGARTNYGRAAG
jgi:PAS domain S-box-containing protein